MPWGEKKLIEIREEFIQAHGEGKTSMSALCREYGISRKTGYKWLERNRQGESLKDHSRRPLHSPNKIPAEIEARIVQARQEHPTWGARKLLRLLQNQGENLLPSTSTVCNILRRNGLITPHASALHTPYKRFERAQPNELWQMDFKGDFVMENGARCFPLTLLDDCSRYSLCIAALPNQCWAGVQRELLSLFEEYGLPDTILSDNGPPWGNGQSHGMTKFEVWMMQLDILPIHGRALHPQTQGKEERFHRTMKEDLLLRSRIEDLVHAQLLFDTFRKEYNAVRPHEALGWDTPSEHYAASKRLLPKTVEEPSYGVGAFTRRINKKGYMHLNGVSYYLGEPLSGHLLSVEELPDDCIRFCYGNFEVAKWDLVDSRFLSRKIFRL